MTNPDAPSENLTKLEYFSSAILAGLSANQNLGHETKVEQLAELAVSQARALITALNQPCSTDSQ